MGILIARPRVCWSKFGTREVSGLGLHACFSAQLKLCRFP